MEYFLSMKEEKLKIIILKRLPHIKNELVQKYKILTNETTIFKITTYDYECIVELGNHFFLLIQL